MTKSEIGSIISYLIPLGIAYTGAIYDNPYIIILGSVILVVLSTKAAILCFKYK
jgi:hypothetical protein